MRLTELEPRFLRIVSENRFANVESLGEADGIAFLCPQCFRDNGGPKATHSIICWQPTVGKRMQPGPGRWHLYGTDFDDLSFVGDSSSSVLLTGGCNAHFFVSNGEITFA